jgi:glycerol-3-phosphate dehydrogenase
VPSHVFRGVLEGLKPHLPPDVPLIMATKGIENNSLMVMPIVEQVYQILHEDKNPRQAVKELMRRDLKAELEY